jgi:PIN domain-containing protein
MRAVQAYLSTFEICSLDRVTLELAAALPGGDFEDNVQIACAYGASLDGIVTRDKTHFAGASGSVYSPTELLAQIP